MEINVALSRIQEVLNHYRAFKDIEEVLVVVGEHERLINDLNLKADSLKKDIAGLEDEKAGMALDIEVALQASSKAQNDAIAKAVKAEKAAWDRVKVAEARLEGLRAKTDEMEKAYEVRRSELRDHIVGLETDATVAQERLGKIEAKIAELKGL